MANNLDPDVIIVGAGLFGKIIQDELLRLGMTVQMLDSQEPNAGSKPAACLMKPSWFSSLGGKVYEPALNTLESLYGIEDITFKVGPVSTTVHWVNPRKVFKDSNARNVKVTLASDKRVVLESGAVLEAKKAVIVAAGIWSKQLVPGELNDLVGRAGVAYLWRYLTLKNPFISPWAPYRQLVGFNRGDGAWVGDGTAIKPENWDDKREHQSLVRCANAVRMDPIQSKPQRLYGIRPYMPKVKPAYLSMRPGLIVCTGGAKNGTIAAGWCAHEIGRFLT